MKHREKLTRLINNHNGIILTKQITKAGIPKVYNSELVERGVLERLERGVYISSDSFDDEMYRLQAKYTTVIFSSVMYH
jgi:predicted transcriptional regulator of viral defense system